MGHDHFYRQARKRNRLGDLCGLPLVIMHFMSKWLKLGGLPGIGLRMKKGWHRFLIYGCFIGIVYQTLRFCVMYGTGTFNLHSLPVEPISLIISTVILLVSTAYIGFAEEIVFRGYLINLFPSLSAYAAVGSAALFTLGHLIDGNVDVFRISFLFLAGLFFAICYIVTRSLWFVAGIHWFWDFAWFYLGADGGTSSAKIVDVTIRDEMRSFYEWMDPAMAFCLLLLLLVLSRKNFNVQQSRNIHHAHRND